MNEVEADREARRYVGAVWRALRCGTAIPTAECLVERALGAPPRRAPLRHREATVARVNGTPVLFVASQLPAPRARWAVAHEIAAWMLGEDGVTEAEARVLRSRVAAEILLPRDLYAPVLRAAGSAIVADELVVPLATVLLREAELLRRPTFLLLANGHVRRRGDDFDKLPIDVTHARALAFGRAIGVTRHRVAEGVIVRAA